MRKAAMAVLLGLSAAGCGDESAFGGGGSAKQPALFGGWRAEPAMISNHGVYRGREYIWQDYIHDDHGANTDGRNRFDAPLGTPGPDPTDPTNLRQSPAPLGNNAGDFTYASADGTHLSNVADLIELRVAADERFVHYRVRLADLTAPDATVVAFCVNEDLRHDTGLPAWPLGAGVTDRLGCDRFYTVYGSGAQVTDASGTTQDLAALGGAVSADVGEALLEFRVPRSVADPAGGTWRYTVASGLWDAAAGAWAAPLPLPAQAGAPFTSGGRVGVPNIWDLLSNNYEPNSTLNEERQANDLAAQTLIDHFVDVDFARLAEPRDDPDPQLTGVVVRMYQAQYPTAVGRGIDIDGANFVYQGPWQPYTAVIPSNYYDDPQREWAFDLCLHPLGTNHNVEVFYSEAFARGDYNPFLTGVTPTTSNLGFAQIQALVDRLQTVYACVLGRGEGVGYQGGDGMVDALEVEADMLRRYRVAPDKRTLHGVSLGAIGSWYVGRLYPDRYAAIMPYIFTSEIVSIAADPLLQNLHNLPVFFAIGTFDQFAQGPQGDPLADQLVGFGNEFVYLHYLGRQHEGRIENDFLPFTEALAYPRQRVRDPARVRYVFEPARYSDKLPGDGSAYWVSGMTLRDAALGSAAIDVTSLARADELPREQTVFDGLYFNTLQGYAARIRGLLRVSQAEFEALWHPEIWEPGWVELAPLERTHATLEVPARSDGFTLRASNLGQVRLDLARMGLAPGAPLDYQVETDGAIEILLSDGRRLALPAGTHGGRI